MQNLLHAHAVVFFKALLLRPRQQTVGHHKRLDDRPNAALMLYISQQLVKGRTLVPHKRQLSKRMRNVTCALELHQTHHRAAFV